MRDAPGSGGIDRVLLALAAALFLLASPFLDWWARPAAGWYLPYLIWLVVVGLAWLAQRGGDDDV